MAIVMEIYYTLKCSMSQGQQQQQASYDPHTFKRELDSIDNLHKTLQEVEKTLHQATS